jgi:hypothetical protein
MSCQISIKSKTYTEDIYVYTTDISVKVETYYPERSQTLFQSLTELISLRNDKTKNEKSAEVIVGNQPMPKDGT